MTLKTLLSALRKCVEERPCYCGEHHCVRKCDRKPRLSDKLEKRILEMFEIEAEHAHLNAFALGRAWELERINSRMDEGDLRMFKKIKKKLRKEIFEREKGRCYYCNKEITTKHARRNLHDWYTIDHIVPVAEGGKTTLENCVASCRECNMKKGKSREWKKFGT